MQVSKFTTGRIERVRYFLKVGLRAGWKPPDSPLIASFITCPRGMAGMAMPSRISVHFGISKVYGVSGFPCVGCTVTVVSRSNERCAETALSSPFFSSRITACTEARLNSSGSALEMAPRMRASVWSSL